MIPTIRTRCPATNLSAWQAPPPPAGLSDTVIARMQMPMAAPVRTRSMRTISAAAGATLVAAAAIAALVMTHATTPPPTAVAAKEPSLAVAPPLPAGGSPGHDDARTQALEKRVLELEIDVEELRGEIQQLHAAPAPGPRRVTTTPPPSPPAPEPRPPARETDELTRTLENPFGSHHVDASCNPFAHPHGCDDRPRACDPEALTVLGDTAVTNGSYGEALDAYEAALACRPNDVTSLRRAYLAACGARAVDKARAMFRGSARATSRCSCRSACAMASIRATRLRRRRRRRLRPRPRPRARCT